ncbi:hypothetical protein [Streptomyces spectabilis]|uniref:Uncharacterized protein n=1 Tax=Streptomyces spectabilis TaxID=68270 RepID=A0A7W8EZ36_STRST|nr:hypothetical protein [Streptomyces spectabilis]MBB5109018.1 hypothetical protein [Streptomyces spectabilis]GGV50688.1 hypothetical protein GCM10010245_79900 [Streptomyces spectabilis]
MTGLGPEACGDAVIPGAADERQVLIERCAQRHGIDAARRLAGARGLATKLLQAGERHGPGPAGQPSDTAHARSVAASSSPGGAGHGR